MSHPAAAPAPEVFRIEVPRHHFTIVSNDFCRSKLPPRAKVVALYLLSMRDGYTVRQADIAKAIDMGLTTVKAALADLESAGYLARRVERTEGRVTGSTLTIRDTPAALQPESDRSPTAGIRPHLQPESDRDLQPESGPLKKTNYKKTKKTPPGGTAAPAPGVLDLDLPETPTPAEQKQSAVSAVVAAYVDAFTARTGARPLGSDLGKIGSAAKRILADPGADLDRLVRAATRMADGHFTDLATEYRSTYGTGTAGAGGLIVVKGKPQTYFYADDAAIQAEIEQRALTHPEPPTELVF